MSARPDLALMKHIENRTLMESDHRIANSLAMIAALVRVQAGVVGRDGPLEPARAQFVLEEAAARIEAVARLHRLLAQAPDGAFVEPAEYLREICELAQQAFDRDRRLELRYELIEGVPISARRAAALGLAVNEAIINALKYAHPDGGSGQAIVSCQPIPGDCLMVSVEDDGVGLPEGVDETSGGLGFRIMRSLAAELEADLRFRSSPLGLTVQLVVPI